MKHVVALVMVLVAACGSKTEDAPKPVVTPPPTETKPPETKPVPAEKALGSADTAAVPTPPEVPAGQPPADGKYERVIVDGVTVPMVNVMEKGTVILVDTDGAKPRTWEEQYKAKRAVKVGQYDVHKTDANKNGKFDDDAIDKEGLWVIDTKGNLTKH